MDGIKSSSTKKVWVRPEITGVSPMNTAKAIDNKTYFSLEGTFDGVTYIGPHS
jgi:hypothetical protein